MKKAVLLLLSICTIFCLTGCFEAEVAQRITGDGNVTESVSQRINRREYINYMNSMMNATSDNPVFSDEYVDNQMKESGSSIQVINGVEYYVDDESTEVKTRSIPKLYKQEQNDSSGGGYQIWERGFVMTGEQLADDVDDEMDSGDYNVDEGVNTQAMMQSMHMIYSVEFDYDIVSADANAVIDPANPRKATWDLTFDKLNKNLKMYALCSSEIQISGVVQGKSYKKPVKLHYDGAVSAVYNGKEIVNDTTFSKHGQHTVVLQSAGGERRTVTFFIDKKKPVISKLKNNKTYKKNVKFKVIDKDSGVSSVKVDGKKASNITGNIYTIKKRGKHNIVVKDNAGNVKKLKINVK